MHERDIVITRNPATADKPRDVFRCQIRSPKIFDTLGMIYY